MADTNGLVAQLQSIKAQLLGQQSAIEARIQGLDAALAAVGAPAPAAKARVGRPPGRRRGRSGRAPRAGSLKSFILKVMKPGEGMAVKDIAVAVRRAGYRTNSNNFPNQVSNALAQMKELSKVGRGVYRQ